jgi:hypothetical protein
MTLSPARLQFSAPPRSVSNGYGCRFGRAGFLLNLFFSLEIALGHMVLNFYIHLWTCGQIGWRANEQMAGRQAAYGNFCHCLSHGRPGWTLLIAGATCPYTSLNITVSFPSLCKHTRFRCYDSRSSAESRR